VEIVIMSKRGLQIALKSILHPGPHEYIVTSLKEVEICQKWKKLLKQKAQKRILKTKMASQSVPMIWFVREDWTDKKASAPSQWHPDTSLSYSWDLHTDEKVLNRQLDQFEEQYQKERQKDKKEEKQGLLLQKNESLFVKPCNIIQNVFLEGRSAPPARSTRSFEEILPFDHCNWPFPCTLLNQPMLSHSCFATLVLNTKKANIPFRQAQEKQGIAQPLL
jgi:hypothetical protein